MLVAAFLTSVATPEFAALDRAIAQCDRSVANAHFASEPLRRSRFLTDAYREQEQIVRERQMVAERRRALREQIEPAAAETADTPAPDTPAPDTEEQLTALTLALEDRQHALNDRRLLETLRQEALDAKRRLYLTTCSASERRADRN